MASLQVTAEGLNVRAEPTTASKVLTGLRRGTVVEFVAESDDALWLRIRVGALEGWASGKYLAPLEEPGEATKEEFPWMPIALAEIGVREYPGLADNPRVVEYLHSTRLGKGKSLKDSTAWCSAFVNWSVEKAGYAGTDSAWARDWAFWGQVIPIPRRGCIAVFRRPCDGKDKKKACGHVAFFLEEVDGVVRVLGGNQGDQVGVAGYPKADLLAYRVPL